MKKFTLANFVQKMRDPEQRKYFYALFGGKLLGIGACFIVMMAVSMYFSGQSKVHAQTNAVADATNAVAAVTNTVAATAGTNAAPAAPAPAVPDPAYVSPINTMWVLITAFLVFFMQAGFMFLEAGFARERETINVLLEGIVDTCLCGVLFYCWGFAWMFGHGNGYIGWGDTAGHSWYCLQNLPDTYESTGVATLAIFLFQFAFADTCSTITSGAMLGRTGFWGDLWYSIGVSGFLYPIFGHWAWGPDGWLNTIKPAAFLDFMRLDGGAYHRRHDRARGCDCPRSAFGTQIQAGRRRAHALPQYDRRLCGRRDLVVRLVRLQSGQHAFGHGHCRHCPGGGQHHPGGLLRRIGRALVRLSAQQEMGLRGNGQRLAGRSGGHHLSVLLGVALGCSHPRRSGRGGRYSGHRSVGISSD